MRATLRIHACAFRREPAGAPHSGVLGNPSRSIRPISRRQPGGDSGRSMSGRPRQTLGSARVHQGAGTSPAPFCRPHWQARKAVRRRHRRACATSAAAPPRRSDHVAQLPAMELLACVDCGVVPEQERVGRRGRHLLGCDQPAHVGGLHDGSRRAHGGGPTVSTPAVMCAADGLVRRTIAVGHGADGVTRLAEVLGRRRSPGGADGGAHHAVRPAVRFRAGAGLLVTAARRQDPGRRGRREPPAHRPPACRVPGCRNG